MSEIEKTKNRDESLTQDEARQCNKLLDCKEVEAIPVEKLLNLGYSYRIPDYQRGYRWTEREVETMLNDIEEAGSSDNAHCLQPLVIKFVIKTGDTSVYNVIDGQQRLTTISIILAWCEKILNTQVSIRPVIEYETRPNSKDFLSDIAGKAESKESQESLDNIDFFNMSNAYLTCKKWQGKKLENEKSTAERIRKNLLNSCYFILYNVAPKEKEHEIFKRLNSGKIALTNTELTKALLLHGLPYKEQIEKALLWDEMIRLFEADDFWYFICADPECERYKQTRFDYLLELVTGVTDDCDDRYASFREICKKKDGYDEWLKKIAKYFHIMKFWYEDVPAKRMKSKSLYHIIGFLILKSDRDRKKVTNLLEEFSKNRKADFIKHCIAEIIKLLKIDSVAIEDPIKYLQEQMEEYKYGQDNAEISNMLLLMNIATLEADLGEDSRYSFASHVREKWSLEHIHARNEKPSNELLTAYETLIKNGTDDDQTNYRRFLDEYNTNGGSSRESDEQSRWKACLSTFEKRYKNGMQYFSYEESFGNLALLPHNTNSSFGKKPYVDKRKEIVCLSVDAKNRNIKHAIVPICTRYIFFKYFSPEDHNNIIWDGKNAEQYERKAAELIAEYLELKSTRK